MNLDDTILELVESADHTDQAGLARALERRGFAVTQPTLSRHLSRLGVRKVNGIYRKVEEQPPAGLPGYELRPVPPNLLVLKTRPGHAQLMGVHLDQREIEGMAGTVAGDDTIFIAVDGTLDEVTAGVKEVLDTLVRRR